MPYEGRQEWFTLGNTTAWPATILAATDPLLSIGGWCPIGQAGASRPYRSANSDSPNYTHPGTIHDTQIDDGATDPRTGDWAWVSEGANGGFHGKVIADDQVSTPGSITIDRELPSDANIVKNFHTFKPENVFDNIDAAGAVDGYVDYRQIWFLHNDGPNEGGFRFHIDPIKPNGCELELAVANEAQTANTTSSQPFVHLPADRFTDPFLPSGIIADLSVQSNRYQQMSRRGRYYSPNATIPQRGTTAFTDTDQWLPVWLKRTVRPGTRAGECVFVLRLEVDNPTSPDPDPYRRGLIMPWFVAQPTYSIAVQQDRIAYTGRSARMRATITDSRGVPVPNLNAWMVMDSGDGTITSDQTARTNALGQISALYTSPSTLGVAPVVGVIIPTNPET